MDLRPRLLSYPISVNSKGYELLVREIYQQMLDQDQALNVAVQHNFQKQGNATSHQIDVYWEFWRVAHSWILTRCLGFQGCAPFIAALLR